MARSSFSVTSPEEADWSRSEHGGYRYAKFKKSVFISMVQSLALWPVVSQHLSTAAKLPTGKRPYGPGTGCWSAFWSLFRPCQHQAFGEKPYDMDSRSGLDLLLVIAAYVSPCAVFRVEFYLRPGPTEAGRNETQSGAGKSTKCWLRKLRELTKLLTKAGRRRRTKRVTKL